MESSNQPKLWGGIGDCKSNGGRQWYMQNRIYDADYVAIALTPHHNPYYIIQEQSSNEQRLDR